MSYVKNKKKKGEQPHQLMASALANCCKPRDIITAKDEQKSRTLIQNFLNSSPHEEVPNHLTLDPFQYKGLVNQIIDSKWVGLKINELLVVEYYSRQT